MEVKFLKYCAVTLVLALFQEVVILLELVPYLAVLVFKLEAVHPENV